VLAGFLGFGGLVILRSFSSAIILPRVSGLLIDRKPHLFGIRDISLAASLPRTKAARVVARLGVVSYRLGLVLAALVLVGAVAFAVLLSELLVYRVMTLVFLGIIPAVAVYATGWMLFWIMGIAGTVCDFSITLLYPKYRILADTTANVCNFLICFTRDAVRWSNTAFKVFLHACYCGLRQIIAAAALCSAVIVRVVMDACRYFFMVITFAVRLVARILIAVLPQEFSAT